MTAYVYRLFDAQDRLLYVGLTENPARRLQQHIAKRSCDGLIAHVSLATYSDRIDAAKAEREAIRSESPIYNVRHSRTSGHNAVAIMRAAMCLTVVDLARLAQVDEDALCAFEDGEGWRLSPDQLKSVTDALGKHLSGAA